MSRLQMEKNRKRVMILGAGNTTSPLIARAKEIGYEVIVVSPYGDYPGFRHADLGLFCDFRDNDTILRYARALRIDAIAGTGTDIIVPTIGQVVDAMDLHGPTYDVARRCADKWLMKNALLAGGVMTARGQLCKDLGQATTAAEDIGYPLMCKAVDCSGSEGIFSVDDPGSLAATWERSWLASPTGRVVLEQFLSGLEFGAQAVVEGTRVTAVYFHNDQVTPPPVPAPIGHSMPCTLSAKVQQRARTEVVRAIAALGIRDTIANIDLMLVGDTPYIIEIGARMGATCLPETISLFGGFDAYTATLALALGQPADLHDVNAGTANASCLLRSPISGIVAGVEVPESVSEHPNLHRLALYCKPGDHVRAFRVGPDRVGDLIVTADSAEEAQHLAMSLSDQIVLHVDPE